MSDSKMSDIIRASLDGVRDFADINASVGTPIQTPNGVTVIPISKVSVGFATGGLDFGSEKNFGGGGGTGVTVTPIAFLTVDKNSSVNLITLSEKRESNTEKAFSLIESTTDIIQKIKSIFD